MRFYSYSWKRFNVIKSVYYMCYSTLTQNEQMKACTIEFLSLTFLFSLSGSRVFDKWSLPGLRGDFAAPWRFTPPVSPRRWGRSGRVEPGKRLSNWTSPQSHPPLHQAGRRGGRWSRRSWSRSRRWEGSGRRTGRARGRGGETKDPEFPGRHPEEKLQDRVTKEAEGQWWK